ncbi:MAG: hypothetical protein R3247_13465, partial [Rhodothermales bacterium]|nr:hypothetical protein [Rhodothermales bacterium]
MAIDFDFTDRFAHRHIGPSEDEVRAMLEALGYDTLEALMEAAIPEAIRTDRPLALPPARTEHGLLDDVILPRVDKEREHNWHQYVIR